MSRMSRRVSAWIAILAMTLNALWPVIAQAKPGLAATLQEVCTSAGLQKLAVDAQLPAGHSSGTQASPHCAFCSFGADRIAIPSQELASFAQPSDVRHVVPSYRDAPSKAFPSQSSAQPRAPPFPS